MPAMRADRGMGVPEAFAASVTIGGLITGVGHVEGLARAVDRDGLWVIDSAIVPVPSRLPAICAVPASVVTTALVVWR